METEPKKQPDDDADEESVEDFKREIEEDPSLPPSDDPDLERQRGG